jgi:hypothetical protein
MRYAFDCSTISDPDGIFDAIFKGASIMRSTIGALLVLQFATTSLAAQQNPIPSAPPLVRLDPNQCTKIGKYHHCLVPPTMLAVAEEQFNELKATAPSATLDPAMCKTVGNLHYCPLTQPSILYLTDEQFNALTKPSSK